MPCILGCWRNAISGLTLDSHSPSSFQEASKEWKHHILWLKWMSVINDVSGLEWTYTKLLRTSYTTSSPHNSAQRRQNVSHRFILSGRRQWVYAHPTVLSSFLQWQIGLLSLVLKLHLKNHSYDVGTTTHLDTFDTDYDLTAVAVQVTDFVSLSPHYYSYTAIPCMYTDTVENAIFVTSHLDSCESFPVAECRSHYNYAIKIWRKYSF